MTDSLDKIEIIGNHHNLDHWVGLSDRETEDTFRWADGRNVTSSERDNLFYSGQPDNYNGEDCGMFVAAYSRLNDQSCVWYTELFVCEIMMT